MKSRKKSEKRGHGIGLYHVKRIVQEKYMGNITLESIEGDITRASFLDTVRGQVFNLDGLVLDFTNDNQGSDMVLMTYLSDGDYVVINSGGLKSLLQR